MVASLIFAILVTFQLIIVNIDAAQTCSKIEDVDVDISLPDQEQLLSFINSQAITVDLINRIAVTEIEDFKNVMKYHNAEASDEVKMSLEDIIKKNGYDVETHTVTTTDGYVLTMQRIPGNSSEKVVFLQHGLLTNAADWVTVGPENALSYYLASQGYDVWLGNMRGNKYSEKNVNISSECAEFWDYSFHENGYYDLPAMVDYTLSTTGASKLVYMGHSQGTTASYVLCSKRPEYNDKFKLIVSFAPVAYMSNIKSPFTRLFALNTGLAYKLFKIIGVNSLLNDSALLQQLVSLVCGNTRLAQIVCSNVLFLMYGFDVGNIKIERLPVIISHFFAGASSKQLAHFGQLISSARFCEFDYGTTKNQEVYGANSPPDYDLSKITAPFALVYAENDWFSNSTDVKQLMKQLPNVVSSKDITDYNHVDHVWGRNLFTTVHPYIQELLDQYDP